jgi:hypothetical protein
MSITEGFFSCIYTVGPYSHLIFWLFRWFRPFRFDHFVPGFISNPVTSWIHISSFAFRRFPTTSIQAWRHCEIKLFEGSLGKITLIRSLSGITNKGCLIVPALQSTWRTVGRRPPCHLHYLRPGPNQPLSTHCSSMDNVHAYITKYTISMNPLILLACFWLWFCSNRK